MAQLAWIAEKFHDWTDPGSVIPPDRRLTNAMLYWLTRTVGSSARLYAEPAPLPTPADVPIGVAVFAGDVAAPVRRLAEQTYDIVHWSEFPVGGHFAALEQPRLFTTNVQAFVRSVRTRQP